MLNKIRGKKRLLFFRILRANLPWIPINAGKLFFLKYDGLPANVTRTPFKGNVCWASEEHVHALAQCCNKPDVFRKRFDYGNHCLMALNENKTVVGYEWFSLNSDYHECKYNYDFSIPDDTVYAFDAFILNEYRMQGIWNIFKEKLSELMQQNKRNKIITYIEFGNLQSFKTHFRYGFEIYEMVDIMNLGKYCLSRQHPITHCRENMQLLANPQRR